MRVPDEPGGRAVLETTPPPETAEPAAATMQGDELDALLGPAKARDRPGRKGDEESAAPAAAPVIGLQSRGSALKAAPAVVGDGGASWRRRAQQRSRQRAAEEGRSVDDGVLQRSQRATARPGAPRTPARAALCPAKPPCSAINVHVVSKRNWRA